MLHELRQTPKAVARRGRGRQRRSELRGRRGRRRPCVRHAERNEARWKKRLVLTPAA